MAVADFALGLVLAHGLGGRSDLPLPVWLFAYSAVGALVVSFLLLGFLWQRPLLAKASVGWAPPAGFWSSAGQAVATAAMAVMRLLGLALFLVVAYAALLAPLGSGASIAPVAVFVIFWVGLQLVAGVLGDVWKFLNPWTLLVTGGTWVRGRLSGGAGSFEARSPQARGFEVRNSEVRSPKALPKAAGWFALVPVAAFLWLELAHPESADTRLLGWGILVYTLWLLGGAARYGQLWLAHTEGFGVLLGAIGKIGIFHRGQNARLRLRLPLTGLAELNTTLASTMLILLVLGSTTYDGLSGTRWWGDLTRDYRGWDAVPWATLGLLGCVVAVTLGYFLAIWVALLLTGKATAQPAQAAHPVSPMQSAGSQLAQTLSLGVKFSHSLVPLMLAYSIAHYFSLLVFEGQDFIALLSDPFGQGWDLFGTRHFEINYRLVSTEAIALVQALSIVVGHIGGVVLAHDRALELFDPKAALRSQLPLLAVMVGYTLVGLLILMNA